jgi:hypothetical protein
MICQETRHTVHRGDAGWRVSWLPGRVLDRNQDQITGTGAAL